MIVVISSAPVLAKLFAQQLPLEAIKHYPPDAPNLDKHLENEQIKLVLTTVDIPLQTPYIYLNSSLPYKLAQLNLQIKQILHENNSLPLNSYYSLTNKQELQTITGKKIALTSTEANLLRALASNSPIPKAELQKIVWKEIHVSPQVIETHLSRLKQKLPSDGPSLIIKTQEGKLSLAHSL